MRSGVIARTIVLDRLVGAWLGRHPGTVVVNLACGLDTRCYRMKGYQHWYNLDLPETIATAIRIGNPASWTSAIAARDESGGRIDSVTDDEILAAYHLVAEREALFCEPASAASVAGLIKSHDAGLVDPGQVIVCTLTGNGLKDTHWALEGAAEPTVLPVDAQAVAGALGLA